MVCRPGERACLVAAAVAERCCGEERAPDLHRPERQYYGVAGAPAATLPCSEHHGVQHGCRQHGSTNLPLRERADRSRSFRLGEGERDIAHVRRRGGGRQQKRCACAATDAASVLHCV